MSAYVAHQMWTAPKGGEMGSCLSLHRLTYMVMLPFRGQTVRFLQIFTNTLYCLISSLWLHISLISHHMRLTYIIGDQSQLTKLAKIAKLSRNHVKVAIKSSNLSNVYNLCLNNKDGSIYILWNLNFRIVMFYKQW